MPQFCNLCRRLNGCNFGQVFETHEEMAAHAQRHRQQFQLLEAIVPAEELFDDCFSEKAATNRDKTKDKGKEG